jgi:hypothetical protein
MQTDCDTSIMKLGELGRKKGKLQQVATTGDEERFATLRGSGGLATKAGNRRKTINFRFISA